MPTRPVAKANQLMTVHTSGPNTNGMNMNGFSRMGAPKMTGSLMPKMEGTMAALPMALYVWLLESSMKITRPSVRPEPVTCRTLK